MRPLLQASIAATLSWLVSTELLGHPEPIFAPISALVAIGATIAQPWQRAVEIVVGVSIGVGIADLLVVFVGQGWWQVGVFVFLAMGTCIAVGGSPTFVIQGGIAALLVASMPTADGAASVDRVIDTLIGGLAALVMTILVLPVHPMRLAYRAAGPVLDELAATFDDVGAALASGDVAAGEQALERARRTSDYWAHLNEAVGVSRQAARVAPVRRHEHGEILDLAACVVQLDYAIRDGRVLARVAWRLTETGTEHGARLQLAMSQLARTVRALDRHFAGEYDATLMARAGAVRATRLSSSIQASPDDFVLMHLLGQVRSTTVDLLRATGLSRADATDRMLEAVALGRADVQ